jgi:hypothetical protein
MARRCAPDTGAADLGGLLVVARVGGGEGVPEQAFLRRSATRASPPIDTHRRRCRFHYGELAGVPGRERGLRGQGIEKAVFYPDDDQSLIERDLIARHYEAAGPDSPG